MSEESRIGLAELIEQVKRELLSTTQDTEVPLLSVDTVELELQVTVRKEGKAGLKVYVVEMGGGGSLDDIQKVKVTLSPLLTKEARLAIYQKRYPQRWTELMNKSVEALTKGGDDNLGDEY
ncbi:MAG: trypco2 family protein [Scytonema sp. PMC 1069.18]|nr:trypco2 family protein [Scytonema sp. PMC 1069.18]MEC4886543.1 trypco2 family protein [Scytonema sp. PMC 1070.18]